MVVEREPDDVMYDVFVVRAGFSKLAGIPLTSELFNLIVEEAKRTTAYDNILKPDITHYLEYYNGTRGQNQRKFFYSHL
jgi:hypothetical protein